MAGGQRLDCALLRFRATNQDIHEVPLWDARAADLAAAEPWRTFRWHKGQQHYSGWWWSSTMGGQVIYESRLEFARLILADFDPSVRVIVAQPFPRSSSHRSRPPVHRHRRPAHHHPRRPDARHHQTVLTSQLARLEADLGQQLIERARPYRQCELTPAGREFLQHARRIIAALDHSPEAAAG